MEDETKERKPSGLAPLKIIVLAGIVLVVVLGAANHAALANTVKKTFLSPVKYYQGVEAVALADGTGQLTGLYGQLLEIFNPGDMAQSVTVRAEAGTKLQKAVKMASDMDISELGEVSFSVDALMKKDVFGLAAVLSAGKKTVVSGNGIIDIPRMTGYVQIPEINKTYLGVEIGESVMNDKDFADDFSDLYEKAKEVRAALPSPKELDKICSRYIKAALSQVTDVTKGKGEVFADGISQSCTTLTVSLDEDDIADMLDAVLTELERDKELKKLFLRLCEAADADGDELYDAFLEYASDWLEEFIGVLKLNGLSVTMTLYVNGKGELRGRTAEVVLTSSYSEEYWIGGPVTETRKLEFEKFTPVNGKKTGLYIALKYTDADGNKQTVFKAEGNGSVSMGKLSGEYKIKAGGLTVAELSAKAFDVKKLQKGILCGSLTVKASDTAGDYLEEELPWELREFFEDAGVMPGKAVLEITLDNSAKSNSVAVRVMYKDEPVVSFSVERRSGANANTKLPSGKELMMAEEGEELREWFEECNFDGFFSYLRKIPLPEPLVDGLEEIVGELQDGLEERFYQSRGTY